MRTNVFIGITVYFIFFTCLKTKAQDINSFFFYGYTFEKMQNTSGIATIVNDYNQHNTATNLQVDKSLKSPGLLTGFIFGLKMYSNRFTASCDIHLQNFTSSAKGFDSLGTSEYFKKISIKHPGISMNYIFNLVHAEKFRMGPGGAINIEKFKMYYRNDRSYGTSAYEKPVEKFLLSISIKFPFSFGEKKFNFDIIPYLTIPFMKIDASNFNQELNMGYSNSYSTEDMKFSPSNMGVTFTFNHKL